MNARLEKIETTSNIGEDILKMDNVSVAYSGNLAVKNVSFNIAKNKITSIIGPSGCGKSTLLMPKK